MSITLTKTYVRIYGPPLLKAIRALEGVAVEMSKAVEVKFSHKCVPYPTRMQSDRRDWNNYLKGLTQTYTDCYEPQKIISDAGMTMGDHDFMFEWSQRPSMKRIQDLIEKVDEALMGLGVLYTITTE
jgi:hypothetical protein